MRKKYQVSAYQVPLNVSKKKQQKKKKTKTKKTSLSMPF